MSGDSLLQDPAPIEIAMAYAWDTWRRWSYLIPEVKQIGVTYTPDDWVPILVWDLGLEEIVPFVGDLSSALAEGPRWQRLRGTEAGILLGLGWVDGDVTIDVPDQRHDWWQYQLQIPDVVNDINHLKNIAAVANLSKSAEDELLRIHTPEGDLRPIRRGYHTRGDNLYGAYSGFALWAGGPLISQAHRDVVEIEANDAAGLYPVIVVIADCLVGSPDPAVSQIAMLPLATAQQSIGWPSAYGDSWKRPYSAQSQPLAVG